MKMNASGVSDYFSLWTDSPVYGGAAGVDRIRQPTFFLGVFLGAVGSFVFNHYRNGIDLDASALLISLIVSFVTFPVVYERAGLARANMSLAKWCVAFQYGFFWEVILDIAGAGLK